MLAEIAVISASASGTGLAVVRACHSTTRVSLWDVARDAVRGYWARELVREQRTTLLALGHREQVAEEVNPGNQRLPAPRGGRL